MAYLLKRITIRTNNSDENIKNLDQLWDDVSTGKIPLLFNSDGVFQKGISPVGEYSAYENDETGGFDFSIIGVHSDFFKEMADKVEQGLYRKYEETDENDDLAACVVSAWKKVWTDEKTGVLRRAFTEDYESDVHAEYTKDGKAHCYIFVAIK